MKIYTKKGDDGSTGLLGGSRVPKHHMRIEAYGNIDELNSWIGLLREKMKGTKHADVLLEIQDRLFTIGSHLAVEPGYEGRVPLPQMDESDVQTLEKRIDEMDAELPPMTHFVLPGGNEVTAFCHIARCVCRRSERSVTFLTEHHPVDKVLLRYVNRLSDYLFTLGRKIGLETGAEEMPWKPRKSRE
jgi:cob(I)alamin adenosyltransferase